MRYVTAGENGEHLTVCRLGGMFGMGTVEHVREVSHVAHDSCSRQHISRSIHSFSYRTLEDK